LSIAAAQAASYVDRVIVSTDDPEIAETALEYGAEVPFLRPRALGQDDTPDLPVFQHALTCLRRERQPTPELLVHLRPTNPLRTPAQIDAAVTMLRNEESADSVRSVVPPFQNPFKMWQVQARGELQPLLRLGQTESFNMPRQLLPPVYWHVGYVDVLRPRVLDKLDSMTGRHILPLVLDEDDWIDIDTERALQFAEFLIVTGRARPKRPVRRPPGALPADAVS
jgi:N-acylneuraminate cytidylyltransferase